MRPNKKDKNKIYLVLSCEHASHLIPADYKPLFATKQALLKTHRGWDPGTLQITQILSKIFKAPMTIGKFSRLLVDLNRSPGHPAIFSDTTKKLSASQKAQLMKTYHEPHWNQLRKQIQKPLRLKQLVVHIGIHSFTPVLKGQVRKADIGLLFHSGHQLESQFCKQWQKNMKKLSNFKVYRNNPYIGKNNSLQTHFRKEFKNKKYLGIELEINQKHLKSKESMLMIRQLLQKSLLLTLNASEEIQNFKSPLLN